MGDVSMEELYSIMRDLLEIEYNQRSLLHIIKVLESNSNTQQKKEVQLIVNGVKYFLETLQIDLKKSINRMDKYIIAQAAKER